MITARSTDARNPSKIMYLRVSTSISEFNVHFRGSLVGVQVSSPTTPSAYTLTVVDSTTSTTLISAPDASPSGTPYLHETLANGVLYLPAPDSQLGSLPIVNPGDVLLITPSAGIQVTGAEIILEFQGQ